MLEFLANLFNGVVSFLGAVLPDSPFRDIALPQNMGTVLGWLNWVVPFSAFGVMLTAWLAAFVAYIVVSFVKSNSIDVVTDLAVRK